MEYVGKTFIKLPSDSSSSNILHLLLPSLAELSKELITPPFIIVGSNFAVEKIEDNNLEKVITAPEIVSGVGSVIGKHTDDGWKDTLKQIKKNNPGSNIKV